MRLYGGPLNSAIRIMVLIGALCSSSFAQVQPPRIFFSDLESAPNIGGQNNAGAWVTIWGKGLGARRGTSVITVGGHAVAGYPVWSDTKITFQLGHFAKSGDIVVYDRATKSQSNG